MVLQPLAGGLNPALSPATASLLAPFGADAALVARAAVSVRPLDAERPDHLEIVLRDGPAMIVLTTDALARSLAVHAAREWVR